MVFHADGYKDWFGFIFFGGDNRRAGGWYGIVSLDTRPPVSGEWWFGA